LFLFLVGKKRSILFFKQEQEKKADKQEAFSAADVFKFRIIRTFTVVVV
jgi:hypothetical protein